MSSTEAYRRRADNFGAVGDHLLKLLQRRLPYADRFFTLGITDQLLAIERFKSVPDSDPLFPVALSLLCATYPVQVATSDDTVKTLARLTVDGKLIVDRRPAHSDDARFLDPEQLKLLFPIKKHPAAKLKVNVYLVEVLDSAKSAGLYPFILPLLRLLAGKCFNDQATSAILYAVGLRSRLPSLAIPFAATCILNPDNVGGLSNALKALGANSSLLGATLTEGKSLLGRGVAPIDLRDAAAYRCDKSRSDASVLHVDQDALAAIVGDIIDEELAHREITYEPLADFWTRRWAWCVNGSHSRLVEKSLKFNSTVAFPGVDQVYRRMFSEAYPTEPISTWNGRTYVSASTKLEHGKTRAIFACDSRSYFAFEHLLGPVSAAWLNSRVLLDPGKFGHLGIARRVLGASGIREKGVNIMLDYDDFNSQHSIESQQTVIRVLCEKTQYPPDLADTLIKSFADMNLYVAGKFVGRATGTLMSGHRGTTFLNSVLNAAYIRMACGSSLYSRLHSLHVGDDVYISAPSYADAGTVLKRTSDLGCRMNPAKQSVGTVGAEFLRLGIRKTHAVGYLARSVASAVSGNWVNLAVMAPRELISSAVTTTRALINRSQCSLYPQLLARSLSRAARVPLRVCINLLSGSHAIDGSPVFKSDGTINTYSLTRDEVDILGPRLNPQWPSNATQAYLTYHATPVELKALELSGSSIRSAMLVSSYNKALASNAVSSRQSLRLRRCLPRVAVGSISASKLLTSPPEPGVLSGYMLLSLLKARLNNAHLRELISLAGFPPAPSMLATQAWGAPARSVVIQGYMSYSDAATLSSRTYSGVVYTTYPVYM